jgi:hemin uptake protein HemP
MRFILIRMDTKDSKPLREMAPRTRCDDKLQRWSSAALLQGQRQIVIEHAGREYRLRVTAQGKLILTA